MGRQESGHPSIMAIIFAKYTPVPYVICKWQTSFSQQVQPSRSFELCVSVSGDLSVGVCNKEQLYALIDAETEIFLIYSLFFKKKGASPT
jgi:hypothetical protein